MEFFEVNTKGLCLLCLKDGCPPSILKSGEATTSSQFKVFLRYLKINTYEMCHFSSSFLQSMDALEDCNIVVTLCNDCSATINTFSRLYQDMEMIRLQLDSCLQSVHCAMQNGKRDSRVSEYRRRMRSRNMFEMFNASVADSLRNEALKKCSKKVDSLIPRVSLLHPDQNAMTNIFSLFAPAASQQRKIPGPKSKTKKIKKETSKLKQLLSHNNSNGGTWNKSVLHASQLGNSDDNGNKDESLGGEMTASSGFMGNLGPNGVECSEEFVIKVEPIIADTVMTNYEDDDDNAQIDHELELDSASAIANFDGQIIGHFLGGGGNTDKKNPNGASSSPSSATEQGGEYFCNLCPKSFASQFSLGGHMHVHKNRENNKYKKSIPAKGTGKTLKRIKKHAMKKKKYKCSVCKKVLTTPETYRAHFKRYHGGVKGKGDDSSAASKTFDCEVCGKQFFQHTVHRTHMLSLHSMHVFAKYLPPGATEDQLDAAIQGVLAQHREILDPVKKKSKLYGCQFCFQVHPHPSHLRLHFLRSHFDKVLVMLQNAFTDDDDEKGLAVNGVIDGNAAVGEFLSSDLGLLLGGDGEDEQEEYEQEVEPQPILLSESFSLADDGDDTGDDVIGQQEIDIDFTDTADDPLDM